MEDASEKRRKRGRPTAFAECDKGIARTYFPDVKTERGRANICYQQRAIAVLVDDPRFFWLGMDSKAAMAGKVTMRRAIVQELGRITDDDAMRRVAEQICKLKPNARQAISMIRRYRGTKREGTALHLANILIATLNRYLEDHPAMTWSDIEAAIRTLNAQAQEAVS